MLMANWLVLSVLAMDVQNQEYQVRHLENHLATASDEIDELKEELEAQKELMK